MMVAALALYFAYLGVGFGLRTWLQWRRTGDTGFRGLSGRALSPEWWAGVLFVVALVAGLSGPVVGMAGLAPLPGLGGDGVAAAGLLLAVGGIVATFVTQVDMGTSWRIGVDAGERTELVTRGAFRWVRNPIFTAMGFTGLGLALMVPNVVSVSGVLLLLVALQLQVRVVEEPYLQAVHGEEYAAYASRAGRFLPGLGRLRSPIPDRAQAPNSR